MKFEKKSQIARNSIVTMILIIGIGLLLTYLSTVYYTRYDFTADKQYSLSDVSKDALQSLNDNIVVKVYFSNELPSDLMLFKTRVDDLLHEMSTVSSGNLSVQYLDPEREDVREEAQGLGIPEIQMNVVTNDKYESKKGYLGLALLYQDKTETLPVVSDSSNLEYDILSKIQRLTQDEVKTVGFLTGHGEHGISETPTPEEYSYVAKVLESLYNVQSIDISDGAMIENVDTLVIPGPSEEFSDRDLYVLDQFVMAGGNMVVLVDGVTVTRDMQVEENSHGLGTLLSQYGISTENDLVIDYQSNANATFQQSGMRIITKYPFWVRAVKNNFSTETPIVSHVETAVFPWVSSLIKNEVEGVTIFDLIKTTENSAQRTGTTNIDPGQEYNDTTMSQFTVAMYAKGMFTSYFDAESIPPIETGAEEGDDIVEVVSDETVANTFINERTEEGGIIVVGDSDFATNTFINMFPENIGLFQLMVDALTNDLSLSEITLKQLQDRSLNEVTPVTQNVLKFVGFGLIPLFVIVFGVIRTAYRKYNKNKTF